MHKTLSLFSLLREERNGVNLYYEKLLLQGRLSTSAYRSIVNCSNFFLLVLADILLYRSYKKHSSRPVLALKLFCSLRTHKNIDMPLSA
jgi:hypothetical protein